MTLKRTLTDDEIINVAQKFILVTNSSLKKRIISSSKGTPTIKMIWKGATHTYLNFAGQ